MSREKPNILFLFDDQHHARCLSFEGHPLVKTPHLDALARKGAAFRQMFSCSAICGPSRTSFFTGTYLRTHGQYFNDGDLARPFPSILTELKKENYTTFQCGKDHLPQLVSRDFDEMWTMDTMKREFAGERGQLKTPPDYNQHFQSATWDLPEKDHRGVWTAQKAIDFLETERAKQNPFFMWVSFAPPHSPHTPPKVVEDMYRPEDIDVDWDAYYRFERATVQNRPMIEDFWKVGAVRHDIQIFQKAVCRYLALITLVDRECGRILKTLDERGLADDTIVIFAADHGDFAGHWGQLGKNLPAYDDLLRIPFIYYDPYVPYNGRTVEGMHQNVDLFPTLLKRLGLETPPTVQGQSFLQTLEGYPCSRRDAVFAETAVCKTVRTCEWKLNFYARHPNRGQLFRMVPEADEVNNLWDDPDCRHIKRDLMEQLMFWMVSCEQPNGMDHKWERHLDTRWFNWLKAEPGQIAYPAPTLVNEK